MVRALGDGSVDLDEGGPADETRSILTSGSDSLTTDSSSNVTRVASETTATVAALVGDAPLAYACVRYLFTLLQPAPEADQG